MTFLHYLTALMSRVGGWVGCRSLVNIIPRSFAQPELITFVCVRERKKKTHTQKVSYVWLLALI